MALEEREMMEAMATRPLHNVGMASAKLWLRKVSMLADSQGGNTAMSSHIST